MATSKSFLAAAALLTGIALAAPAVASEDSIEVRSSQVRTNDLDLSSAAGQSALQARIDSAVRKVCLSRTARGVSEYNEVLQCEAAARSGAEAQFSQRIAAYRDQRTAAARSAATLVSD